MWVRLFVVVGEGVVGFFFFFQAEDGIRDLTVTGVQTCALPISQLAALVLTVGQQDHGFAPYFTGQFIVGGEIDCIVERSEEHTSELQSQSNLVCRLLLEKKKNKDNTPGISRKQKADSHI